MSYCEDKEEKIVKHTLGIIYTCGQQRKDSKTKSEEGVVCTCREFVHAFQTLSLIVVRQKCGSKTGSKCQKASTLKCLTFV